MINLKMKGITKALALGVLFTGAACTNLDETVYSEVTADNFFNTPEEVASGIGAVYTQWNNFIGEPWSLAEVSSDEVVVPTRGQDWFDNGNWQRVHLHNNDAGDDRINGSWNELFRPINTANRLIFQFEQSLEQGGDAELIGGAIAELRGMRALAYFYLMDLFGNVPIVFEFDVPADFAPSNGSGSDYSQRTEVYNTLISELEAIRDGGLLKGDPDGVNASVPSYGQWDYWATQALLAKLYLNEGVYTNANPTQGSYIRGNVDAAEAALADIFTNGPFSLTPTHAENFATLNDGSSETVFALVYDQVFSGGFNLHHRTLHYGSQNTYDFAEQPWNGYCTLEEFYNMYDDEDVRKESFIVGAQITSTGAPVIDEQFEEGRDVLPADNPSQLFFDPVINELEPGALRQAGARIGKYEFAQGNNPNLGNDYQVFRLGELIHNWAEIQLIRDGQVSGDALALINQMRTRANQPEYAAGEFTIEELTREKGRETAFEYWRRNDLIRWGLWNQEWWGKAANQNAYAGNELLYGAGSTVTNPDGTIVSAPAADAGLDPGKTVFPIPRAQLQANPNLSQNPGYAE